jgi:orotate phosphoribosyltransferase
MPSPRARLLAALRERSFKTGSFKLASGKTSDFFIDCKRTVLTPEGHALSGHVVLEELEGIQAVADGGLAAVAAVPLGGCPLAGATALLAFQRGDPLELLYVRLERKDHGTGQRIEGGKHLEPGARVVLVEDVVTTGGSSLRAVDGLKEAGFKVLGVVALVDRLEGARESFASKGVPLHAIFDRTDFLPG